MPRRRQYFVTAVFCLVTFGATPGVTSPWPADTGAAAPAASPVSAEALYALGRRHERAEGVPRDHRLALEHYCAAAEAGHAAAAFATGWMYMTGTGVAPDRRIASAWFARAAADGHGGAARMARRLPKAPPALATCDGTELARIEHGPPERLVRMIERIAREHAVDETLAVAVVAIESGFRTDAVSPRFARGLMQLMPDTAARFGVKDPFDPAQNLRGGMRYLRWLIDHFEGDVVLALAAYNAGEGAVRRYGGVPPFAETRGYIEKIRRYYPRDRHPVTVPATTRTQVAKGDGTAVPSGGQVAESAD